MKWHIGCSGFHYKHWRERFYPGGLVMKNWFAHYNKYFNTVELNVTHYRFPREKTLMEWYDKCSSDFTFSVKMYKGITHYKKLHDCKQMVDEFYEIVANGLREKAACILFQFPPSFHFTEENVERILRNVNPQFHNVVEFRHGSWWNEGAFRIFFDNGISFCGMSHPDLPSEIVHTNPLVYYRMHGRPQLYASSYSPRELEAVRDKIKNNTGTKTAYIYFNNDSDANAVNNALELKDLIDYGEDK